MTRSNEASSTAAASAARPSTKKSALAPLDRDQRVVLLGRGGRGNICEQPHCSFDVAEHNERARFDERGIHARASGPSRQRKPFGELRVAREERGPSRLGHQLRVDRAASVEPPYRGAHQVLAPRRRHRLDRVGEGAVHGQRADLAQRVAEHVAVHRVHERDGGRITRLFDDDQPLGFERREHIGGTERREQVEVETAGDAQEFERAPFRVDVCASRASISSARRGELRSRLVNRQPRADAMR